VPGMGECKRGQYSEHKSGADDDQWAPGEGAGKGWE
jgi:hypothetical protein